MADVKAVDASAVIANLSQLARNMPEIASQLIEQVAIQIANDAKVHAPKYMGPLTPSHPQQGGELRAHVDYKPLAPGVWIVYDNMIYAAYQHEGEGFNYTDPTSEPKYIERPMLKYGGDMAKEIARKLLATYRKEHPEIKT